MKALRITFANATVAARWVKNSWRLLNCHDVAVDDPCSITLPLKYPFQPPRVSSAQLRGIENISARISWRYMSDLLGGIEPLNRLASLAEAAGLLINAKPPDAPKLDTHYAYWLKKSDAFISFRPLAGGGDISQLANEYRAFFGGLGLPVQIVQTESGGVRFETGKDIQIKARWSAGPDKPVLIDTYVKESRRGEFLKRLMRHLAGMNFRLEPPEISATFAFSSGRGAADVQSQLTKINKMCLPIRQAKCDLYYTLQTPFHLDGLSELKKKDKGKNTIEATIASCVLASGLKGWITATARNNGILLEIHSQTNPDEDAFIREARALLKEHLPK